jgi:hypothetical protein
MGLRRVNLPGHFRSGRNGRMSRDTEKTVSGYFYLPGGFWPGVSFGGQCASSQVFPVPTSTVSGTESG